MNIRFTHRTRNAIVLCLSFVFLLCAGSYVSAQTTVTLYPGTTANQTARVTSAGVETSGSISSSDGTTIYKGYAVFDLSSIPAGATITSCVIGFNVSNYGGTGTPSGWNTYGYAGDLSLVTDGPTLYSDCTSGTSLTTESYGTATGSLALTSTDAADTFIAQNIGSTISICFTGGGSRLYRMTGYTGTHATTGAHAPYLQITYCVTPMAGTISGPSALCTGSVMPYSSTGDAGGSWASADATISVDATGNVTALSAGTATISYIVNNACGADTARFPITISDSVHAGTISGVNNICPTTSTTLTASGDAGGTWTVDAHATVDATGVVTGVTAGTANISYTVTGGCNADMATYAVIVNPAPNAGVITGNANICTGASVLFTTDGDAGGTWSSSDPSATVDGTGNVSGASVGSAAISYSLNNSCGTSISTFATTISTPAAAGIIVGATTVCPTASIMLIASGDAGGTWTADANASVDPSGVVTGITAGTANISYAVTGACNTDVATYVVTVKPNPNAGTITGSANLCRNAITLFTTSGDAGGTWSSADATVSVDALGNVTAVSAGTATISYSTTNSCGTALSTFATTIADSVHAGTISGTNKVCTAATTTLMVSGDAGGMWTVDANATVDPTGVVTGVTAGAANVTYTVTSACNTDMANYAVTVDPSPNAGTITGNANICTGASALFSTDGDAGGAWTSSDPSASVDGTGNVTGASAGSATISYSTTNSCGTAVSTFATTISTPAVAGTISGVNNVCPGSVTTLSASGNAGGTWTVDANASVDPTGIVTGNTTGTANITYTVTSACNTDMATYAVTVNAHADSGIISGPSTICLISTITLSETVGGGTWTSTPEVSVDATGMVTPVSLGTATVSYTVGGTCGNTTATYAVTVSNSIAPNAGTISGAASVCQGASTLLSETVTGGLWSCSAAASVDASGNVTGVSGGTAIVSYIVTSGCGADTATYDLVITPLPLAGAISGPSAVCVGSSITLLAAGTPGGTWISSDNGVATVDASGSVTGAGSGPVTISYAVINTCGTDTGSYAITVNPLPDAGSVSGASSVCVGGSTILLSETISGGSWNGDGFASVDASGNVTGISAGVSLITYTVFTASCGSATATYPVTVNPAANAGAITGAGAVCSGFTTALADATASDPGTWASNNNLIASVDAAGNITGNSVGSTTITYSVTNGCGSAYTTFAINVTSGAMPTAGTITGATHVCIGSDIILTDPTATSGGTWSSSNTAIATVDPTGDVVAMSGGTATISYIVSTGCFADTATYGVTADDVPYGGAINGLNTACLGTPFTLTDPTGDLGGAWNSSNHAVATIDASGNVTSVAGGTTTISYTASNTCGSSTAIYLVTINPNPDGGVIGGPTTVCEGVSITLTNTTTTPGGTWSSSTTNATVDASGVVTGVLAGSATISYTYTNMCGTATSTYAITVNPQPVAGTITGPVSVCATAGITLADATGTPAGIWTSSDNTLATVDASGNVTGLLAGSVTLSYTASTVCGSASATYAVTVNPQPNAGAITGPTHVCEGTTITLSNPTALAGGTWSSSSTGNATVDASGNVTGVLNGTTVITYLSSTVCGVASATYGVTVDPQPNAGTISGTTTLCTTYTTTLVTDGAAGGVWSSSDNTIATVSASGIVTGVAAGAATISYASTTVCGTQTATAAVTINVTPAAGTIVGSLPSCVGSMTTISDAAGAGTWSSSDNTVATINASGNVTATGAGNVTVSYTVTSSGCSGIATLSGTIYNVPVVSAISGSSSVCVGGTTTLTDTATLSGIWSSSNAAIASVDASGIVTGVTTGTAVITYTETNAGGCSAYATFSIASGGIFPATYLLPLSSATLCDSAVHLQVVSFDTSLTYTWYLNGSLIAGDTASNYFVTTPGVYDVVVSVGCLSETLPAVTVLAAPTPTISLSGINTLYTGSYTTYQWYLDSVAIPGATNSVHIATTPGVYIVAVSDGNGCVVMSATDTLLSAGVANIASADNGIKVYPNPATSQIHIDAAFKVNVTLLTTLSKTVISQNDAKDIDISNLANGMYMIMIYDEHDHLLRTEKVVKSE